MKTLHSILLIAFFNFMLSGFAQDMQEGFTYLETGEYAKAESFFDAILKDYPKNKTARLCYGRAIGLNGKAEDANILFTDLLKDYPNDFEVKLNYGESLLWNKNYKDAKTYYQSLVDEDPKSFAGLLGFANTLSNLKEYEAALKYLNKALDVSPGNSNALNSKKYIYLGYAYQNQQNQNYDKAERLLVKNLELFGDDKDTLLNLGNLYLIMEEYDKAELTYERLANQEAHKTLALNGLALVMHLKGKEKRALQISTKAYKRLDNSTEAQTQQQTTERYVQALIWNRKYKSAKNLIGTLITNYPNENWVLALRATLNIYKSDFKASLKDYNRILKNDSTSFDGNLGKANVLKAMNQYKAAYTSAQNTLTYHNNQKDAINFIDKMNLSFNPVIETKASHTFDNGDNKAFAANTNVVYPLSTRLKLMGNYNYRNATNDMSNNNATASNLLLGVGYQLFPEVSILGSVGLSSANAETSDYSQLIADIAVKIKPYKLQSLDLGYKRQVESFNAELLDRELVQNNFYANYNLNTNFNLGFYGQYMYTAQSDDNQRNLLFTSLYYNLLQKPTLKVGLNYQHITFKDQLPTIYFSPYKFNAYEVFVNIIKNEDVSKPRQWFYNLTATFGYQYIEDDPKQTAYRLQAAFGYKLSERALLNAYGTHSNIASATAAGFTFTEVGLRFKWTFLKKKMF